MKMQTSFNPLEWKEDSGEEFSRMRITGETPEEELRRLYPFQAVLKKDCKSYGLEEGMILNYARVKLIPQFYPIEAVIYTGNPKIAPKTVILTSTEAQVREV